MIEKSSKMAFFRREQLLLLSLILNMSVLDSILLSFITICMYNVTRDNLNSNRTINVKFIFIFFFNSQKIKLNQIKLQLKIIYSEVKCLLVPGILCGFDMLYYGFKFLEKVWKLILKQVNRGRRCTITIFFL